MLKRIGTHIDMTSHSSKDKQFSYAITNEYITRAKKNLSEAVLKILLCAKHTGQWNQRKLIFDNEETRYLQRFKPFQNLNSPPHPSYEVYSETMEIDDFDLKTMKSIISNNLDDAKKILEYVLTLSKEETNTEMCHDRFIEVKKKHLFINVYLPTTNFMMYY